MKRNEDSYSFLLFTIKAQHFAMPLENLVEVTEEVHVSSLPFVPDFVDGLINLNSKIIPQVHAQKLLFSHIENATRTDPHQTLLVFKSTGPLYALRVGYVLDTISVEASNIDFFHDEDVTHDDCDFKNHHLEASQAALIEGEVQFTQTDGTAIQALIFSPENAEKMISDQNNHVGEQQETGFLGEINHQSDDEDESNEYLIFTLDEKQFATPLIDILEVIDLESEKNTQLSSHQDTDIISSITLIRNNPLAILDLRCWLKTDHNKNQKTLTKSVIILSHDNYYFSIAIDSIIGMVEATDQQKIIDPETQQLMLKLAETDEDKSLNGQQLIEVFLVDKLIKSDLFEAIKTQLPKRKNVFEAPVKTLDVLKFLLHKNVYGILINDIQRVVNNQRIEPLLTPKANIIGSSEYEGLVIPIINLAAQLAGKQRNLTKQEDTAPLADNINACDKIEPIFQEAIVVDYNKQCWGLAIDKSECIIEIKETDIDFLPQSDVQFTKAYASFGNELIHLLNIDAICANNT